MAKKILIVEDANLMRQILKQTLIDNGYEVVGEAKNGEEAILLYSQNKPDLVTMDITMPIMDGISAAREIIRIDPEAKIIMCTAMGQVDKVKAAIQSGAKAFLVKPLKPDLVISRIRQLLGE